MCCTFVGFIDFRFMYLAQDFTHEVPGVLRSLLYTWCLAFAWGFFISCLAFVWDLLISCVVLARVLRCVGIFCYI